MLCIIVLLTPIIVLYCRHAIDDALLRPGRFDSLIYVPPPDITARTQILQIHTKDTPLDTDVNLSLLAASTELYTGADLKNLVREACMYAVEDGTDNTNVTNKHFQLALQTTQASLTRDLLRQYEHHIQQ